MEANHKITTAALPFVDSNCLMETCHQLGIQRSSGDYKMCTEQRYSARFATTHPKHHTVDAIDNSEDGKLSSRTEATPEMVTESRGETKRRRRQELQDSHDTVSSNADAHVDVLLESQIRHYKQLQQLALAPRKTKTKFVHKENDKNKNVKGPNVTTRSERYHPRLAVPNFLIRSKHSRSLLGNEHTNTVGRCGSAVMKKHRLTNN